MSFKGKIVLEPIGYVRTSAVGEEVKDRNRISQIVIRKELAEGLYGIEGFSHLFVLFHLSKITPEQRKTLKVHPQGKEDLPLMGVFATRTKLRPNPIALTLVELIKVQENILTVKGLDAFDGTPVLDVKTFDFWDMPKDARVPSWWSKLHREKPLT